MRTVTTVSTSARVAKKIGVGALLVSLVLASSTPVYAQTPAPTAPGPAPAAPSAPATPPPTTTPPADSASPPPEMPPPAPPPVPEAPPPAPAPAPEAPAATAPSRTPSYVLWTVGGASLIAGTVLGVMALSAKSDFDDTPTYDNADKVNNLAFAADVGLGVGIILLATGTIFYLVDDQPVSPTVGKPKPVPVANVHFDPIVSSHTRGGALTLRF